MSSRQQLRLKIDGMHCQSCVRRVTAALEKLPGVQPDAVEVGSARLGFDPAQSSAQQITEAVSKLGFSAQVEA